MPKVIVHSDYGTMVPLETRQQVEVFQDKFPEHPPEPGTIHILFLCEPPVIKATRKKLRRYTGRFDHILTFDPWVLKRYPQASKFVYGTAWAYEPSPTREFSVSTVIGTKLITVGHRLRQKFWKKSGRITKPLRLFFSRQFEEDGIPLPEGSIRLGDDKTPVFASQFHVAIENCRMPDYFTEKIMDCFMTETVPIYWGCTNIEEYFDPRGIIVCKSLRTLIQACNGVSPEDYENMRDAIRENRERAEKYLSLRNRLAKKIRELIGEGQFLQ